MADEGGGGQGSGGGQGGSSGENDQHVLTMNQQSEKFNPGRTINTERVSHDDIMSLTSPRVNTPNLFSRRQTSLDLDDYFSGPRDLNKHSKWPLFLQMHGSILPKMILPLVMVGGWATLITCVSELTHTKLGVSSIVLTVTGFVVGLGLSFRSSTAYERYAEGRRYWAQLILASQTLGRVFWVHAKERVDKDNPELKKKDMLAKMTAMNLLVAFAVSLKHKLRFEPYAEYDDLAALIGHLDTFALSASREDQVHNKRTKSGFFKATGQYLGLSFAASNPRKAIKRATRPLGNLPLEILTYLASFTDELVGNQQLPIPMTQTLAYNNIAALNDVMVGTERVLTTPLPIAYAIAINQITWVYVLLLPFQLLSSLDWVTIPATVFASYIILGILFIGREIEDPFGHDVNDLPLDSYCAQIATELDVIASRPAPRAAQWVEHPSNKVLFPLSTSSYSVWARRSEDKIAAALKAKTEIGFEESRNKRELSADTAMGDQGV